jgi:hypothetical protein
MDEERNALQDEVNPMIEIGGSGFENEMRM